MHARYVRRLVLAAFVLAAFVLGCSSSPPGDGAAQSGSSSDGGVDAAPAYPTENLGWQPRIGARRGQIIPDLSLRGYAPGSRTMQPVSIDVVYDPDGARHDLAVFVVGGLWEGLSAQMLDELEAAPPPRVAIVGVLVHGTPAGTPSTDADLDRWRSTRGASWALLDPAGVAGFARAFDLAALPAVIMVDARTMEIVFAGTGALDRAAIEREAGAVRARSPAYP
ncbi:MAG: hypothetical protein KF819_21650 [Labilithrix sp.]|nr:hypothetical protein [Labilithrix sp.]